MPWSARRARDHIAGFERALEVAANQRAHLLTLQIVGVVIAGRERESAEHDAALDLGAEALGARVRSYSSILLSAGTRNPKRMPS
jgi:hypothetical protein